MFGFGKRKKQKAAAEEAAKLDVPSMDIEETGEPTELEAPATDTLDVTTPTEPGTPSAESGELVETPAENDGEKKKGLFGRLKERLSRTRSNLTDGLANLVLGHKKIDDDLLEELETLLLMADVGVDTTNRIIDHLSQQVKRNELSDPETLTRVLKEQLLETLSGCDTPVAQPTEGRPQVILMVGINGAGKTTTIGKLAKRLREEGQSVMLAAGDTFRAAAVEQLQAWGERNDIPVIAQQTGADSASVIFDALEAATARGVDVLIADTAGRLHTKSNLMDELTKVARVMRKIDPKHRTR